MQSEFSNLPKLTNKRPVSQRQSSVGKIDGSDRKNTGEMASNLNNSCNQIKIRDKSNEWRLCGCIVCWRPCCFCGKTTSKVTPVGKIDIPQASVSSMRSRMEASSNFPSCTAVSAIPLKAYSQFSHVAGHPMSQIESVFEGLRKKSTESYTVSRGDIEESMTEVSSTDQLQIEIPIVSQKPFYILWNAWCSQSNCRWESNVSCLSRLNH